MDTDRSRRNTRRRRKEMYNKTGKWNNKRMRRKEIHTVNVEIFTIQL